MTGSPRENSNIIVYKPLAKIISKCTAFSPDDRFEDAGANRPDDILIGEMAVIFANTDRVYDAAKEKEK